MTQVDGFTAQTTPDRPAPIRVLLDNALGAFRALVIVQVAHIVERFGFDVDGDLARILPPTLSD